jgi:hypothetical protein
MCKLGYIKKNIFLHSGERTSGDEPSGSLNPTPSGDGFISIVGQDCNDNAGDAKTRGLLATKYKIKHRTDYSLL